jgi:Protein kinase domain
VAVARQGVGQPAGVWIGADEDEQRLGGPGVYLGAGVADGEVGEGVVARGAGDLAVRAHVDVPQPADLLDQVMMETAGPPGGPPLATTRLDGAATTARLFQETMSPSGESSDAVPGAPPGGTIGKYTLVRLIGRGGMGLVYEALHPELRKRVAIKTLLPDIAAQPEPLGRFLKEGEIASRIKHPNVVNVLDVGTHEGAPFLVMEYLEGESLAERFARAPAGPMDAVVDLLLPAIAAVAAGHDEGVVHRDLKPPNIFLERGRRGEVTPKVLDFGISKIMGTPADLSLTNKATVVGTLSYMAPEQTDAARTADTRTDQYAFGLILYEGLTGRRAFDDSIGLKVLVEVVNGRVAPPRTIRPEIPEALERVVLRALRVAPEQRFPTLRALGAALLPFASSRKRLMWEEAFSEKGAASEGQGIPAYIEVGTASTAVRPRTPLPPPLPARRMIEAEDVVLTPRLPAWVWVVPALVISAALAYLAYRVYRKVDVAPPPPVESPRPRAKLDGPLVGPPAPQPPVRPAPGKPPARRPRGPKRN